MQINIRPLNSNDSIKTFNTVSDLFNDMYSFMNEKGLFQKLAKNGTELWVESIKNSIGKLTIVYLAILEDEIIGFSAGNIRFLPSFLENRKGGYVSYVYVKPEYRNKKIGDALADHLEQWFISKNVHFIELEVLEQNKKAINFWNTRNYKTDNLRMFKKTPNVL